MTSFDFAGIERAEGLTPEAAERVEELVRVLQGASAKNAELDLYRDGAIAIEDCTEKVPIGIKMRAACPWGAVAVQSVVERSQFDAFTFPDPEGEAARRLEVLARGSVDSTRYARALKSAITYGVGFVTVCRSEGGPVARWHTARMASGLWDVGEGRLECGLAVVGTGRRPHSQSFEPTKVDVHDSGGVWEITRTPGWDGWEASYGEHPMGEPMMLAMPFLPDDESPLGHTRLSAAVRHVIREYLANALNVHVASTFYAIGQKAVMGLTKEQFNDLKGNKDGLAMDSIFLGMADRDGVSPHLEQWAQQSMEPLLSVKRSLAQDFAAATSVPVSELISQDSNPTSAEALAASKDKLISLVESVNDANSGVLRRAALMLMALDANRGLGGLSEEQRAVGVRFRSPATPSLAAQADFNVKVASVIEGYGQTSVCQERFGFDQSERTRMQSELRRVQARLGATAVLDRNRGVGDEGYSGGAGQV